MGAANALASADALTLSRAAIVGPFLGPVLQVKWPTFNDNEQNLKRWAPEPRLFAIDFEAREGVSLDTDNRRRTATLVYSHRGRSDTLVTLTGPDERLIQQQLQLVAAYADLRPDRALEITEQQGYPVAFWASVIGLTSHRHAKTLQLIELAYNVAAPIIQRIKVAFSITRPDEFSPQIQAMIATPGHGAWPSGHATEGFLIAVLLQKLLDAAAPPQGTQPGNGEACREQLQRLAARIAVNRTVAGVHYPIDSAAGRLLGTALAEFIVARATGGKVHERGFHSALFREADGAPKDFSLDDPMDLPSGQPYTRAAQGKRVPEGPLLSWLWQEALKEWP
ncbi:phosphatase PAP2 family protein [Hydrogenophaga sp. T2]|uniref:phosphatase PAP2 family protein n=1 Tax=Hydrogenophaga sp. T2 TaxID=3132823 RepID=UPI003CEEAACC